MSIVRIRTYVKPNIQSYNPEGFYGLIPVPNIRFEECLAEALDSIIIRTPLVKDGEIVG